MPASGWNKKMEANGNAVWAVSITPDPRSRIAARLRASTTDTGQFVTLPYGKFVHGIYRSAALLRYALERKRAPEYTD
jgi:hypothetical protein